MTTGMKIDHTGSSFESFLEEEGILHDVDRTAREQVMAWLKTVPTESADSASLETLQRSVCEQHGARYAGTSQ